MPKIPIGHEEPSPAPIFFSKLKYNRLTNTASYYDSSAEQNKLVDSESVENPVKVNLFEAWKAISSCLLYSFCSVSMVLVNKSLASSYNHFIDGNLNFLLVVFQAVIAVIAAECCKKMKLVEYPNFNISTAMKWAPINVFFCGMLFTGMASLQHNSVPMVTVFKNLTNIVVCIGDYYFFGTKVDLLIVMAFGVILAGALLAARNDVEIHALGLFWMVTNCLTTAGYILYMKFATKTIKMSKFGMVFYNNVLCTFFLLPVTMLNGELKTFLTTKEIHNLGYALKNSFAGFVGFFLNFASLNCVSNTGPTTYAIVGSLNRIPIVLLGWMIFNSKITGQTWFFIGVSLFGGFLYSYAKIRSSNKDHKEPILPIIKGSKHGIEDSDKPR